MDTCTVHNPTDINIAMLPARVCDSALSINCQHVAPGVITCRFYAYNIATEKNTQDVTKFQPRMKMLYQDS